MFRISTTLTCCLLGAILFSFPISAGELTRGGAIPYFVDGGGEWTTSFTITCVNNPGCAFAFTFIGANGRPAAIPVRVSNGDVVANMTQSTINITSSFGRTTLIETLGQSPSVITGGIDIVSTSQMSGFSTFRQRVPGRPDYEATVVMESRNFVRGFIVNFDNRDGFATGIALTNLTNNARADVIVEAVDLANNTIVTSLISLDALNSTSFDVAARFPQTAGRTGLLIFSTQGTFITGTGFRFNPTGPFTTLPIFNLR